MQRKLEHVVTESDADMRAFAEDRTMFLRLFIQTSHRVLLDSRRAQESREGNRAHRLPAMDRSAEEPHTPRAVFSGEHGEVSCGFSDRCFDAADRLGGYGCPHRSRMAA